MATVETVSAPSSFRMRTSDALKAHEWRGVYSRGDSVVMLTPYRAGAVAYGFTPMAGKNTATRVCRVRRASDSKQDSTSLADDSTLGVGLCETVAALGPGVGRHSSGAAATGAALTTAVSLDMPSVSDTRGGKARGETVGEGGLAVAGNSE